MAGRYLLTFYARREDTQKSAVSVIQLKEVRRKKKKTRLVLAGHAHINRLTNRTSTQLTMDRMENEEES